MDLYSRYLLRQATNVLLMILLSLTGVVWIATALKQLTLVTSKGQDTLTFLTITMLALPNLLAIIMPVALLITIIHTLNKANGDSELIVMTASGAPVWRFARPFVAMALVITLILGIGNFFVLPWSARNLEAYITKVRTDLISQVLRPGEFSAPDDKIVFHIRERDSDGQLLGLMVQDDREKKVKTTIIAERAVIRKLGDDSAFLVMFDGHIIRAEREEETPRIIFFEQYAIDLNQMSADPSQGFSLKPRARYLHELLNPDPDDWRYKNQPGKFRSELHERFASLLYPLAFVFICLAHLGVAQTNRQSKVQAVVNAFAACAGLRLLGLASTNLVTQSANFVPLTYAVPILGLIAALIHAHLRMRPRKPSKIGRFAAAVTGRISAIVMAPANALGRWRQGARAASDATGGVQTTGGAA